MVITLTPTTVAQNLVANEQNGVVNLQLNISTKLRISAQKAKQKVTRFLLDEVNMFVHPDSPMLAIGEGNTFQWRFPLSYTLGKHGRLGQVGVIDVDAQSGRLLLDEQLLDEINLNVKRLAHSATCSANI